MATYVIVHGAFGGGWEWTPVARLLREHGHDVFTPTLTGLGERAHLGPAVGLATHVADVVGVLELEDLHDVVLCGASFGGMAVTGAADRVPSRVALLVHVDALVPDDGESALDLLPGAFGAAVRAAAGPDGDGWVAVPDAVLPPRALIPDRERTRYVSRLRPHPAGTFTEPLHLTGGVHGIPRAFVRCTRSAFEGIEDPIAAMAARARARRWTYRELAAPHDPHLFDPHSTAAVLHGLAAGR